MEAFSKVCCGIYENAKYLYSVSHVVVTWRVSLTKIWLIPISKSSELHEILKMLHTKEVWSQKFSCLTTFSGMEEKQ